MLAVIIGRRRQGKSTLALALAKAQRRTTVVFDPNDQYGNLERVGIEALDGWLQDAPADAVVRIVPEPPVEDAWHRLADVLDGGSWRYADYVLVLDECSMLMNPNYVDPALERYARTSPADVDVILTTHRPRDVHSLLRALATDTFVFQTTLARDVQVLRENYGDALAQAVQRLPQYHVAHYWLAAGGVPQTVVWDKPSDWYIDIGRKT